VNDLERRLVDLGAHLDAPAGDGLVAAVSSRLAPARRVGRPRRRLVLGLAALLAASALAVPAIADRLDVGEVAVRQAPPPTTSTTALDLGRRVTLPEAARVAGFAPLRPAGLGEPDEVWVDTRTPEPLVWMRWRDGPLLTQVAAHFPEEPMLTKYLAGATVERVLIGSRPALWIEGAHALALHGVGGDDVVLALRPAASTLLVEIGDVTVRIELPQGRAAAVRLAESLPGT
jgi:hypothetical protein